MRKIFAFLLTFIMALSTTCVAFAGEMPAPSNTYPVEYEYFDDGSYIVTTITEEPSVSFARATSTKTASKTATYKSSSGASLWSVTITGTFSYNGSSAKCTAASVSTNIYNNAWKISNKSASKSGSTAIATATGKQYKNGSILSQIEKTVKLTCSKNGVCS